MSTYEATYIREKRFRRRQTRRPVLETHDVVGRFACDKCSKVRHEIDDKSTFYIINVT